MRHASHASLPESALKVPLAQVLHVRSALAVGALLRYVPSAHGALTSSHALPSFTFENVEPTVQPAHWRSAVAEPGTDWPWPTGHLAHASHAWLPGPVLKWPEGQASHPR